MTIGGAGCFLPRTATVDKNLRFDGNSRGAIVVLGFSTNLYVWLMPGIDDGVDWRCKGRAYAIRARPDQGFVVAHLPARTGKERYAISGFGTEMNMDVYGPRRDGRVFVFDAPPGKVTYLGAWRVVWLGGYGAFVADDSVKQADADDYITRTFPNIPVHVAPGRMEQAYNLCAL